MSRADGVIPFRMERIADKVETFHLGLADLDALAIAAGIEGALDLETGLGGRGPDEFDHSKAIRERPASPVLGDVAEQPVLDLVPLRCARRIMMDVDHEPGIVGELLQFALPEPHTRAVGAAAVCSDR